MKFYEFHDTNLSTIVENAYHAIAIDEHRRHYDACLWSPKTEPQQNLEQRWFVGAHCDVGVVTRTGRYRTLRFDGCRIKRLPRGLA